MSADIEQIEAIYHQTLVQITDLLSTSGPTIPVNGTDVVWAPLLGPLQRTLDWCEAKLAEYQPYEVRSQGKS